MSGRSPAPPTRARANGRLAPAARPAPAFPIRLLALDIDGTVSATTSTSGQRTAAAIREAVRRGVHVSLATGRMATSAAVYANRLGLRDPIIGHQGAVVRAMPSEPVVIDPADPPFRAPVGRVLRHTPMAAAVAREAIAWCLERGLDPHVNDLERIVVWRGDPRFEDYSAYLGPEADIVPDLGAAIRKPVSKVIAVGEPPRPMELIDEARRTFDGRADATVSHPRFLEFVAPGVSKGRAVALARPPGGRPDGPGDGGRRRAQRHRDDRRRRARGGDGHGARRRPRGGPLRRRAGRGRRASAR